MSSLPVPRVDPRTGTVEAAEGVFLLPTLHQSLELAVLVRSAFRELAPTAVALELPRTLEEPFVRAVRRLPVLTVVLYPEGDETVYLLVEPHEPMAEAARLALAAGRRVACVDRDDSSIPLRRDRLPDPYAVATLGAAPYLDALLAAFPPSSEASDVLRERTMAFELRRLADEGERVLWVGGAAHVRGILRALDEPLARPLGRVRREGVTLAALAPESAREVMSEVPWVAATYERARSGGRAFALDAEVDPMKALDRLLVEAAGRYRTERRGELPPGAFRVLGQYLRNLTLLEGALTPGFYELVTSCRAVVDDDYAWEVWNLGSEWPWPDGSRSLPEIRLQGEDLLLEGRKIRFRRRFPDKERRLSRLAFRRRPKESRPGEWKRLRFGNGICSHPPEDIQVERFGNRLRARALRLVSEESRRVQPLTASLLDGIDVRESLRRLHEKRLYVFEELAVRGGAGSVVAVFDEDEARYTWKTTWLGEHGQESDMAFAATPLGERLVGPGISECEYGAFLMTMPPGRLADVWTDPDYQGPFTSAEVLLLAALDYAREPRVVYAARKPPRPLMKQIGARLGKKIVFLPLGSLPAPTVTRLRRFHVLANRLVRTYARDFIS